MLRRGGKVLVVIGVSLLIASLGGAGIFIQAQEGEKPTYVHGIDPAYPPFSFIDEEGNPAGFDIDMVQWIADEMGFNVKVKPIKWASIIPALQAGEIDFIASGMSATEERKKVIDFTDVYWRDYAPMIAREDYEGNLFSALFSGGTVALQRGAANSDWLVEQIEKYGFNLKVAWHDTFPLAVEAVLVRRADFSWCSALTTAKAVIKGKPLKIIGSTVWGPGYAIGVRKGDIELKEMLNEGLSKLKASPKWDELVAKWGLD